MRKIVIAGSGRFHEEVLNIKKELETKGYHVIDYPKKIDQTNEKEYKQAFERFWHSLNVTDDLLLLNLDKNGVEGYIGYESFAELTNLVAKKIQTNDSHKIYIYKMPCKEVGCYNEIKNFLALGYIEIFEK